LLDVWHSFGIKSRQYFVRTGSRRPGNIITCQTNDSGSIPFGAKEFHCFQYFAMLMQLLEVYLKYCEYINAATT